VGLEDALVPKPYPQEFRDDVVRVARNREAGVTIEQIAADFGVHPMTLTKWMRRAAVDDGERTGITRAESQEVRELRRRNRLLEQNAVRMRGDVSGCALHSDRGSQFRSRKLRRALTRHSLVGPIGRVASCGDNAAMESFFALLQKNVLNRGSWATREELRIAIVTSIERTYHRRRRQARLGRLTPIEFENTMKTNVALAA
jgi:transposase InsO family protein